MRGLKVYFIIGLLIVSISLTSPFTANETKIEKNYEDDYQVIIDEESQNIDVLGSNTVFSTTSAKNQQSTTQTMEFLYPKTGYFYNRNTVGRPAPIFELIGYCFWIGSSLESGVQTTGSIDEVEFTLKLKGSVIDVRTDTTSESGKFTCKFYGPTDLIAVYEITAVGYYQGSEVYSVTMQKIIFFKLGSSSNKLPVAVANFDKIVWESKEVQFDGSASYDPDGTIVEYLWDFGDGTYSSEMNPVHIYDDPGKYDVYLHVTDNEGGTGTAGDEITVLDYDFGLWVVSKYEGQTDAVKLEFGIDELVWMLYNGGGARNYHLTLENEDDTLIHLHFARTQINSIPSIMVNFQVEIDGSTDTSNEYEVGIEFRFPYSILFTPTPQGDEYFAARVAYHYEGGISGKYGPHDVHTWFYFGKESLQDPGLLRMKIDPHPYGLEKLVPLKYETSFLTVDEYGNEAFNRQLAVEFDPAPELTITSIPSQGKIGYFFGDETAGETTTIRFTSYGTLFSGIVQEFILDPLPSFMNFDLTILGERSFKYEASDSYDLTYKVDSVQGGNLVKLELEDLPTRIQLSWGLNINIAGLTASGFVDLDMSSSLGEVKLYLQGSSDPFIQMNNFPAKLRVEGSINVPSLSGYIAVSKYAGSTTTIPLSITYDKYEINAAVHIHDGSATASFDLPSSGSTYVMVGLDTNGNSFLGWDFDVTDTTTQQKIVELNVDGIATDNFQISFDYSGGQISNFKVQGKITKFINLEIYVDFQNIGLELTGTWELYEGGQFIFELNKAIEVTFVDIQSNQFKLYGYISLYADRKISITWELIEGYSGNPAGNGWFQVYTFGQPIGDEFHFDFEYDPANSGNYQYGFKLDGYDFIEITRTIMWQTDNRIIPRIWILGDVPLPGDWTVQVLWKGDWYPVPYEP